MDVGVIDLYDDYSETFLLFAAHNFEKKFQRKK